MKFHRSNKKRVAYRVLRELVVRGGLFDDKSSSYSCCKYNKFDELLFEHVVGMRVGYNYGHMEHTYDTFIKVVKLGVPIWFLKRHSRFIAHYGVWIKSQGWYGDGGYNRLKTRNIDTDRIKRETEWESLSPFNVIEHCTLPYKSTYTVKEVKKIDGKEYYHNAEKECYRQEITGLVRFGLYPSLIVDLWRKVRDRYLSIYGLDCKMCKKHKKNKGPICNDLDKYSLHICKDCLKKFCKLSDDMKELKFKNIAA